MPFIHLGEPRSLAEHIADLPMLTRHLWRYFWNGDGIRILFRLRILLFLGMGVFYLLLPFDLLPEVVFGIFGKFKTNYVISYSLKYKLPNIISKNNTSNITYFRTTWWYHRNYSNVHVGCSYISKCGTTKRNGSTTTQLNL